MYIVFHWVSQYRDNLSEDSDLSVKFKDMVINRVIFWKSPVGEKKRFFCCNKYSDRKDQNKIVFFFVTQ